MMPTDEEIISAWKSEYETILKSKHPKVKEKYEKFKGFKEKITIWLGGPGKGADLYHFRSLVKKFLESENFEVIFAENFGTTPDLATSELLQVIESDSVIMMALSVGSSSECIEFSHHDKIRPKMRIFIPKKYDSGFVYRALDGRHRLISQEESIFSYDGLKDYSPELPIKILERASSLRHEKFASSNLMESQGTLVKEGTI